MPQAWPEKKTSYYTLFVLTVVVMFTVLDRQVLSLMIEPVKADFGISDTQVALLFIHHGLFEFGEYLVPCFPGSC